MGREAELMSIEEIAPMSEEDKFCVIVGLIVRFRAMGCSGRALARSFGYSKSTVARVWMPAIDRLAPHLGQDGWQTPSRVKDVLARDDCAVPFGTKSALSATQRQRGGPVDVRPDGPWTLINRDPNDVIADMELEMRDEATRLAARVAAWLATIGRSH